MENKRGISPLIATVLLIAFAVALGVIIINIGSRTIPTADGDVCSNVKLDLQRINDKPVLCYNPTKSTVEFILRNNGETDISEVQLRIIDTKSKVFQVDLENSRLVGGAIEKKETSYQKTDEVILVEFVPKVLDQDTSKLCPSKSVSFSILETCQ